MIDQKALVEIPGDDSQIRPFVRKVSDAIPGKLEWFQRGGVVAQLVCDALGKCPWGFDDLRVDKDPMVDARCGQHPTTAVDQAAAPRRHAACTEVRAQ